MTIVINSETSQYQNFKSMKWLYSAGRYSPSGECDKKIKEVCTFTYFNNKKLTNNAENRKRVSTHNQKNFKLT